MKKKKIGLVLSGGGVKSLAHVGFIQALLEQQIVPSVISGTSGGAIVGGLYASGCTPSEILNFFKKTPIFKFNLIARNKPGLIDSEKYLKLFPDYFPKTFEELQLPLFVAATDLIKGKLEYFSSGELLRPIIASVAFPPYFSPIRIGDGYYTDGGILNNFPSEPIANQCEVVLGSFVNSLQQITEKDINTTFKLLQRIYTIGMDSRYFKKFKKCDFVFLPEEVSKIGTLETSQIDNAYQLGYQLATQQIDNIIKLL